VLLESGDKVPADLRLVDAKNLRTEEAALTGESIPAEKTTDPVSANATVGDRDCMAFSGTMVVSGQPASSSRRVTRPSLAASTSYRGETIELTLCIAIFDCDVLTSDIAGLT
jgi:P-type E1-E2 ATPase